MALPALSSRPERSPCPYLNTLANHGFINRNGFNVSRAQINDAFDTVFNIDPAITDPIVTTALTGTTSADPDTLNLNDLNTHERESHYTHTHTHTFSLTVMLTQKPPLLPNHPVIEHDGSLSRNDFDVGNNADFNETIWSTVMANFPDETISLAQMAQARTARLAAAQAANPSFNFTAGIETVSLAEVALVLMTFADGSTEGGANTLQVDTFFREERVPFDFGFVRPAARIATDGVGSVSEALAAPPAVSNMPLSVLTVRCLLTLE